MRVKLLCMPQTSNLPHMFLDKTSQLGDEFASVEETRKGPVAGGYILLISENKVALIAEDNHFSPGYLLFPFVTEFPVWLLPLRARCHVRSSI